MSFEWKIFITPKDEGLCPSCTWGLVRKGFRAGQREVLCRLVRPTAAVPFSVSECSEYTDRRVPEPVPVPVRTIGFVSLKTLDEASTLEPEKGAPQKLEPQPGEPVKAEPETVTAAVKT
jgi:hypothetical protein